MSGTLGGALDLEPPHAAWGADPTSPLAAFERLDAILRQACAAAELAFGEDAAKDAFRGLYVTAQQAASGLEQAAGTPLLDSALRAPGTHDAPVRGWKSLLHPASPWSWLRDTYALSEPELDAVLVALAPEVDVRYERLYGYLHDDVTRRRPTVDLVLNLVSGTAAEKLHARRIFDAGAPLVEGRVLRLVSEQQTSGLLSQVVNVDPQIVDVLCGQQGFDARLTGWCHLSSPEQVAVLPLPDEQWERLCTALLEGRGQQGLVINLHGSPGSGRRRTAEALAAEAGVPLLRVDLRRIGESGLTPADALAVALREALLHRAVCLAEGLADVPEDDSARQRRVLEEALDRHRGVVLLSAERSWVPSASGTVPVVNVPLLTPGFDMRRALWEHEWTARGGRLSAAELDALAGRFRLGPGQIAGAAAAAAFRAVVQGDRDPPAAPALFEAARDQTAHRLGALARRVPLLRRWDELVLPEDSLAQLREICERVTHARTVWELWGFDRTVGGAQGVSALFTGPPGTGKTMAAQVIASELAIDLFAIDLSTMVSKYIGETEKNLETVFTAAAASNAVLFFDEADALFGRRTEVQDAHDRYANIETSYLLQRMETYDGIAILASNLRENLDDAFTRRLQFIVDFPFPDATHRRRLWELNLPARAPVDPALDTTALAEDYPLTGAGIRNVVVHAAFLAAEAGSSLGVDEVRRALAREYHKMGQVPRQAGTPAASGG